MAHIGFLPVHAKGHMFPASALALHLQQRGHRITVFSIADGAAFFEECGFECVVVGKEAFPLGYADRVFAGLGKLKGQAGVLYTMKSFEGRRIRWPCSAMHSPTPSSAVDCGRCIAKVTPKEWLELLGVAEVEQRTKPSSLDGCPMFAQAYMGRR